MSASGAGRRGSPPIEYSLLLTATLCLLAIGAVMVFSASSATSLLASEGGDGAEYLKRTLVFAAIGLLFMRVASIRGLSVARAATPLMVGVSLATQKVDAPKPITDIDGNEFDTHPLHNLGWMPLRDALRKLRPEETGEVETRPAPATD